MRRLTPKSSRILLILTTLLTIAYLCPHCSSDNYNMVYQLLKHLGDPTSYSLNVAVPQSLYQYYVEESHASHSEDDFGKFVTPHALQPVADRLREIYANDEDFTNGALMIVHQIPFDETRSPKYPVETIVQNTGDCDLFSFIAASIIKAGGLDVILLYYEHEAHMNIGVKLTKTPQDSRGKVSFVMNDGIKYYMAECTGGNWQDGWRVGECPDSLRDTEVRSISLGSYEDPGTGQVSASYKSLSASSVTLTATASYLIQGNTVTLWGQLSPNLSNENITIYVRANDSPWTILSRATTNSSGHFSYNWKIEAGGLFYVRASWSGNDDYAGTDSPARAVTSLALFFVWLLTLTAILISAGILIYFMSKQTRQSNLEATLPEAPS
jgi:hypothetical protein